MTGVVRNILCTRPLTEQWVKMAAGADIKIQHQEFIKIQPVLSVSLLEKINHLLIQPDVVVIFTSKNAVHIFAENYLQNKSTSQPHWRIYCLENATRKAVEKYFSSSLVVGTSEYGGDLATLILQKETEKELYFFCGDRRRNELPDTLNEQGKKLHEFTIYETLLSPKKINGAWDGVAFFSPSAVQSFFSSNVLPDETVCFAIGRTTADSLKEFTNNKIIQSQALTTEKMVQTIVDYYHSI